MVDDEEIRKTRGESPNERSSEISIIDLLAADYKKYEDTVYRETEILDRRITPDDIWKKQQFDQLQSEIGDPFFYGTIESSIGKRFFFLPIRFSREAWLLQDIGEENAKMMVHYKYHRLDIKFRVHGAWREVKRDTPVRDDRYFGIYRSTSHLNESQICFFVFDIIRSNPPASRRKTSSPSEDTHS